MFHVEHFCVSFMSKHILKKDDSKVVLYKNVTSTDCVLEHMCDSVWVYCFCILYMWWGQKIKMEKQKAIKQAFSPEFRAFWGILKVSKPP